MVALTLPLGFIGLFAMLFGVPMVLGGNPWGNLFLVTVVIATVMSVGYVLLLWRLIRRRRKFWAKASKAQKISVLIYILAGSAPVTIPILSSLVLALF